MVQQHDDTQKKPAHKPSASELDQQDTLAETLAAKKLLTKVRAAVNSQNNITLRELDEISPLVGDLDIKFDHIENNDGRHSAAAKEAAREALVLLKKYSPKEQGETGGVIDGNIEDLEKRYMPKPPSHGKNTHGK